MISVAMATYQGMPYIVRQLDSIMIQLALDDEIVISDNGSTDGTVEHLQSAAAKDQRIRLVFLSSPKGIIPNIQNALRLCRGEIIFLSDQDDIWKSGKVSIISSFFDTDPNLLAVQGDAELIGLDERVIFPSFFALRRCGPGIFKNFKKNTWQGCSMAFRHSLLDAALPFPKGIPMHDMWLGLLAELAGKVAFVPEVLISYRRHENNQSGMKPAEWCKIIRWRVCLACAVFGNIPKIINLKNEIRKKIRN